MPGCVRYLLLAIVLTGCIPEQDVVWFDERFEGAWAERWTLGGAVTQVDTVLPGEHGVVFLEPMSMSTALSVTTYDQYTDGLWIEYSSTCGGSPVIYAESSGIDAWQLWLELPMSEFDVRPEGVFERVHLNLPPLFQDDPWGGSTPLTIQGLTVVTVGGPSNLCVLDNLRLIQPGVEY